MQPNLDGLFPVDNDEVDRADPFRALKVVLEPGWIDVFGSEMRAWFEANAPERKALSLFSGAGGLDLGFADAGFTIQTMVELDPRFANTLLANQNRYPHQPEVACCDIRTWEPPAGLKVDIIIGGPPCQTFSAAGRRAEGVLGTNDPRGILFEEYVRILKALQPVAFVFENVAGIVGAQGGGPWRLIRESFESVGYQLHARVLDAADYGVPQHRERLIIVGTKKGYPLFRFPQPTHGPDSISKREHFSAGQALEGSIPNFSTRGLEINGRWGHLIESIPAGLNYSFFTEEMGHPNPVFAWRSKFSDFLYKADPGAPVRTIKAQGGLYTGPISWENRHFSVEELKRLQTFPDTYQICGSRNVQIHQIGNSVPPQLSRILGWAVRQSVFSDLTPVPLSTITESQKLTFRSRKRTRTADYFNKSQRQHSINPQPEKHPTEYVSQAFSTSMNSSFSFTAGADWNIAISESDGELMVSVRDADSSSAPCIIEIVPAGRWDSRMKKLSLRLDSMDPIAISVGYKALEDAIKKVEGIDDLVQLSGYYQYRSKISTTVLEPGLLRLPEYLPVKYVLEGQLAGMMSISEIGRKLDIPSGDVMRKLSALRKLGFEIRNSSTNPQIPEGSVLFPYTFPSLRSRSVQTHKVFFSE